MAITKEDSCWGQVEYTDSRQESPEDRKLNVYFKSIIDRIKYRDDWRKVLKCDGKFYFQWEWDDKCNMTGKPMLCRSAKYYLSEHMTQTEIVNRIFLAAAKAEEHEVREKFLYHSEDTIEWRAPYNTHISIDSLYEAANTYDKR